MTLSTLEFARLWQHVDTSGECWIWQGAVNSLGFPQIRLSRPRRLAYVARLVYEDERGPVPADDGVRQHCGNRRCVRPEHLIVVPRGGQLARGAS